MAKPVTVVYRRKTSTAVVECPLCGDRWRFPFPVSKVNHHLYPDKTIVAAAHFYGVEGPPCREFDPVRHQELIGPQAEEHISLVEEEEEETEN
jgi:hypothetical protein